MSIVSRGTDSASGFPLPVTPSKSTDVSADWDVMTLVEPRLKQIEQDAKRIRRPSWEDYERLKGYGESLVGWFARNPKLRSTTHWDSFIDALTKALRL